MFKKNVRFPDAEKEVLEHWSKNECFKESLRLNKDKPTYIFYDGPPFATGLPHYGHILSGTVKDTVGRFFHQRGFNVPRRFGWDCHGLPVEYEIDKMEGIKSRQQVLDMGIATYNDKCKSIVMTYADKWETVVERMGRWVDFKNSYKTMDVSFMESVWFIFSQLFKRDLVYKGHRIMPYSTACKTPLSNFEANQNYKDVSDPSILVSFPLKDKLRDKEVSLVAWTTTPWTLPSNCALAINVDYVYDIFEYKERFYVMHTSRIKEYLKNYKVVDQVKGSELVGLQYEQPFDFYEHLREKGYFRVHKGDFVTDSNGTAIVHCAPAFGEDDYNMFMASDIVTDKSELPCPIDENGCFTLEKYKGVYVKDADKLILSDLKHKILFNGRIVHSYPFCWRSDTPLIYRMVPSWFIKVAEHREELLRTVEQTNWIPSDIKYKRFGNWLAGAKDWLVSRNRFWGTPMPIWACDNEYICVGSIQELYALSGVKVDDLHRQYIDDIVIKRDGKEFRRIDEVFDCWFESGSMPYAQDHFPFEQDLVKKVENMGVLKMDNFPCDFIGEGVDQTRGWFYTLHVISTLLFNLPPFKNVNVNGIVLAEDGKKMSKRLKNYPDPTEVFNTHGADALRMYLINSPVVEAENLRFSIKGVEEVVKTFLLPWYNALSFTMECPNVEGCLEMDSWIESTFNNFSFNVVQQAESYRLNGIFNYALKFIEDLTNFYIRMNRVALRKNGAKLYSILTRFSIVMAPFCPFFSEYCYQSVSKRLKSVHYEMIEKGSVTVHPFNHAKKVIESIRHLREKLRISLKTPIRSVKIVCSDELLSILPNYISVIKAECNLLEVLFRNEQNYQFEISIKPNFMVLKADKSTIKVKSDAINKLSAEQNTQLINNGSVDVDGIIILKSDVFIAKNFVDLKDSAYFDTFGIILDTLVDDAVTEMKDAREFFSFVQKMRKNSGLSVQDKVNVDIKSQELVSVTQKHYPDIKFSNVGNKVAEKEYRYTNIDYIVTLYKE